MKYLYLFCLVLSFSCKQENQVSKKPLKHNPYTEITQEIIDINAIKYYLKGKKAFEENKIDSAVYYFQKSLENEKNPITYNELGLIENSLGNYSESIKHFKNGQNIDSKYWPNYINEATSYILNKEQEKAVDTLTKMIAICDSDYFIAYANLYLAVAYAELSNCNQAKSSLEKISPLYQDVEIKEKVVNLKNKVEKNCL